MINWDKELERILEDPLFDDVKPPRRRVTSSDRLIAGFQEIMDFYEAHGRLPQDTPEEKSLYHKWEGIRKSEKRTERCLPFDEFGLLTPQSAQAAEPEAGYGDSDNYIPITPDMDLGLKSPDEYMQEKALESILNDPLLADVGSGNEDAGLFELPDYMRDRLEARKEAEYVGKRRPCEDFAEYAEGFREIHEGLKSGRYRLVKFSVKNLIPGSYFVEDGIIGYLAAFEDEGVNRHGDRDGRTRVIYENGSEADIKYKTITKNLSVTGYSVVDTSDVSDEELERCFSVSEQDVETGTIYVLRSKSTRPEIAGIKDLYKIGFTRTSMESRLANARHEPTYLCAEVEIVATWKVYNVKSVTLENLIHKLFDAVQLQLTVDGHKPKEWYFVPFPIIDQAVTAIIQGIPVAYDPVLRQLIHDK